MKALTCEMCGSSDLLKENGVFVCQACGTKYSVEEAKKLMIDGTVSVQGVVAVDQSETLQNYIKLAKISIRNKNSSEGLNYAMKAIEIAPDNIEAWLQKFYALGLNIEEPNVNDYISCGKTILHLDSSVEIKRQIYFAYLNTCALILKAKTVSLKDFEKIEKEISDVILYSKDDIAEENKISEMMQEDPLISDGEKNASDIISLLKACDADMIRKNNSMVVLVKKIAQIWVDYCNNEELRYKKYNHKNDKVRIQRRREQLLVIQSFLPQEDTNEQAIYEIKKSGYNVGDVIETGINTIQVIFYLLVCLGFCFLFFLSHCS